MKQFSHVGIPTSVARDGEIYMEGAKVFVTDYAASDYQIEWLRFEADSPLPIELQTTAHLAFFVEDLAAAMAGHQVLLEPFEPMEGVLAGFILDDGAPIEFVQKMA